MRLNFLEQISGHRAAHSSTTDSSLQHMMYWPIPVECDGLSGKTSADLLIKGLACEHYFAIFLVIVPGGRCPYTEALSTYINIYCSITHRRGNS